MSITSKTLQAFIDKRQLDESTSKTLEKIFTVPLSLEERNGIIGEIFKLNKDKYKELAAGIWEEAENHDFELNDSTADQKLMGFGNWVARTMKMTTSIFLGRFFKKQTPKIVIEGDSWYEHILIRDIVDWLIHLSKFRIYTLAYGGDWLANYIKEGKYLKKLLREKPDVFLLSGGGNDLVGKDRLTKLVVAQPVELTESALSRIQSGLNQRPGLSDGVKKSIILGHQYLNDHFYILMNVLAFEYAFILQSIKLEPSIKDIHIITHGYDLAIPSNNKGTLLRKLFKNGQWLNDALHAAQITNDTNKKCIIWAMLFQFNEILKYFDELEPNFHYIDCLGLAKENDWEDELHLKSPVYQKIAEKIIALIQSL
jgi:lysophospholipase L1-like esterase